MDICHIGASFFGGSPPQSLFRWQNPKVYNGGIWVFFSKPELQDAQRKIRKIVMDICGMEASLVADFNFGRSLSYFSVAKKRKFYNGTNGHFFALSC